MYWVLAKVNVDGLYGKSFECWLHSFHGRDITVGRIPNRDMPFEARDRAMTVRKGDFVILTLSLNESIS